MSDRLVFDQNLLNQVIEEIGQWRIRPFLKITGGEPLMERELTLSALERAHALGIITKLNTNGVLLANERIAKRVVNTGLNYLSISIDGPPEVHNLIRGRSGVFEKAVEGIKNVQRYRREKNEKQLMILVTAVISRENQTQIVELARLMDEVKVDWLNFEFMNFTTKETTSEAHEICKNLLGISETPWASFSNEGLADINPQDIAGQIEAVRNMNCSIPISFLNIGSFSPQNIEHYYHNPEINLRNNICYMPFTATFMVPPHHMVFCIDYPFYFYANLKECSVAEGWYGKKAQEFRRSLVKYYKEQGRNFPHCQRCNWRFN